MKNGSLTDFAASKLIELILDQNLKPGDKLPNEYELAERLGIGRNTIREAIRRLVSRNILIVRQGAGTFVCNRTGVPEDPLGLTFIGHDTRLALELSDVRLLIEPTVAELAASYATEEQIAHLIELCEALGRRIQEGESYIPEDLAIHRYIGECCGNSILQNLTFIMTESAGVSINVTEDIHRGVAYPEHKKIVEAIQRRDPIGARYAMISHLETARNTIAEKHGKALTE